MLEAKSGGRVLPLPPKRQGFPFKFTNIIAEIELARKQICSGSVQKLYFSGKLIVCCSARSVYICK